MKRTLTVAKSIFAAGHTPYDLRKICGWHEADILFFLPAGIRPVKGNLECLHALEDLWQSRPELMAVFAGPILAEGYGEKFAKALDRLRSFPAGFS